MSSLPINHINRFLRLKPTSNRFFFFFSSLDCNGACFKYSPHPHPQPPSYPHPHAHNQWFKTSSQSPTRQGLNQGESGWLPNSFPFLEGEVEKGDWRRVNGFYPSRDGFILLGFGRWIFIKKLKWVLPIKRWLFDIGIWKEDDGIMEDMIFWKTWLKKLERDLGFGVLIRVVWK